MRTVSANSDAASAFVEAFCVAHNVRDGSHARAIERATTRIIWRLNELHLRREVQSHWSRAQAKRYQFRKCGSILVTILISVGISLAVKLIWAVIVWWWERQDG